MLATLKRGKRLESSPLWRALLPVLGCFCTFSCAHAQNGKAVSSAAISAPILGQAIHLVEDRASDSVSLIIDLSDEATYRIEALSAPNRLVIDLDRVVFTGSAGRAPAKSNPYALGVISSYRAGLVMAGQSRIVIDLATPALFDRIDYVRQSGVSRLVAQIRRVDSSVFETIVRADHVRRLSERRADPAVVTPVARSGAKPVIVIDPGHGGIDPGASGLKGEAEKDIVLAFAKVLQARLVSEGTADVALTREDDRFISLRDRVKFARDRGASLFISLHADTLSEEGEVFGASVYTSSDRASDAAAARAAEKENRVDLMAGLDLSDERTEGVGDILFDLTRRETRLFSQVVARDSISALRRSLRVHKTPLRAAGFRVLQAPDVPSILIELGYLSNADDLLALNNPQTRDKLAQELAGTLSRFLAARRPDASTKPPDSAIKEEKSAP